MIAMVMRLAYRDAKYLSKFLNDISTVLGSKYVRENATIKYITVDGRSVMETYWTGENDDKKLSNVERSIELTELFSMVRDVLNGYLDIIPIVWFEIDDVTMKYSSDVNGFVQGFIEDSYSGWFVDEYLKH